MRSISISVLIILMGLMQNGCTYGPETDRSKFVRTELIQDGRAVLFTYQRLRYRPASGMAAFPDGGIPKYTEDATGIGLFDVQTQKTKVLHHQKNKEFVHGHGPFHLMLTAGDKALISRGGQTRAAHKRGEYETALHHYIIDVVSDELEEVDLAGELAAHGRAVGQIRELLPDGTLIFLTPSLQEAERDSNWNKQDDVMPELWVRKPDGNVHLVAATHHYEGVRQDRVIWWSRNDRLYRAYDLKSGSTSLLGQRLPPLPPKPAAVEGVSLGTGGKTLQYGVREQGGWKYQALPVDLSDL